MDVFVPDDLVRILNTLRLAKNNWSRSVSASRQTDQADSFFNLCGDADI